MKFHAYKIAAADAIANNTEYNTAPIVVNFTCYGSDDINFTEMEFYLND